MKKHNVEFYDFEDVIKHLSDNTTLNIYNLFSDLQLPDPFISWCKFHEINPFRTKTLYDVNILEQFRHAEDYNNFICPFVAYDYELSNLVQFEDKYNVGNIDLNTLNDKIYEHLKINEWSVYWKKYEERVYSLNSLFVELFIPFSTDGQLTVFLEPET